MRSVSVCSAAIRWQHCHITPNHNMELLLDCRLATLLQSHRLLHKNSIITHKKTAFFATMIALHSPLVRNDVSLTSETVSSSSSCGIAPSSLARENHPQRSCRPHRTHRCQNLLQSQRTSCLGKPLSAWR